MSSESAGRNSPPADGNSVGSESEPGKGISDSPDTSNSKRKGDDHRSDHGTDNQEARTAKADTGRKLHGRRYFIIKSLNHQNIQLSIEKGIWATQVMNEPILDTAFHNSEEVILIFSVNMSGFFQGYARMMSSVGWRRDNVWGQGSGGNNPWGKSFKVKWLRLSDLPFEKTLHLKNPLNDYKPVKISRDCQELTEDTGEALCQLLDEHENLNAYESDGHPSKRHCVKPAASFRGGNDYSMPPLDMPWMGMTMIYPSPVYQNQAETRRMQPSRSSHTMVYSESFHPDSVNDTQIKKSRNRRSLTDAHTNQDKSPKLDISGFSAEKDPLHNLSEDDFLQMDKTVSKIYVSTGWRNKKLRLHRNSSWSYEEYLEAYNRIYKRLRQSAPGKEHAAKDLPSSRNCGDDIRSSHSDRPHSHKRHHVSSYK